MTECCNPKELCESIAEFWSPQVISKLDNYYVKLAKLKDSLTWHSHQYQDKLFLILKGRSTMEYADKIVHLREGDLQVVPKGIMHNPIAMQECIVMLIEHCETDHTGGVKVAESCSISQQLHYFNDYS